MWVLRVIFLMVGFSGMLSLIGCKGVDTREETGFEELVNMPFGKQSEEFFPVRGSIDGFVEGAEVKEVVVEKGSEVAVQIDGQYELFDVLKMVLGQLNYSVVCASVGLVNVSIDGRFTESELLDLSKGICDSLGFTLNVDGRVCTVVRVAGSGAIFDFVSVFRTKYILLRKEMLSEMSLDNEVRVLVYKNVVVVVGKKLQVLKLVSAIKLMDIDYLKGFYVKFVSCFDADKVISAISGMYEMEGVKVIKVSVDMVVVVTNSPEYLEYVSRMIKSLSNYSGLSEVYVYKSKYRDVEEIKSYFETIEKVDMKADKELSAIFFKCSYERFLLLKKHLVSFDILSKQILMRLYMVDVRSSKDSGFGLDWSADAGDFKVNKTGFGSALTGGISGVYQIGNVKSFFKMLEKVLDAKVINKPSVFVKSGQKAEIKFTRSVPVLTSKGSGQSVGVWYWDYPKY